MLTIGSENLRGFEQVWMVNVVEGKGTSESPSRIVHYFFDKEGKKIGVIDIASSISSAQ